MAATGGIENGVDHQHAIVGAEQQHVVAGQLLAGSSVKAQLFQLAAGDLAVIAQNLAQGRHHIGVDTDALLVERIANKRVQRLFAVGIAREGPAELCGLHEGPQRILG
ncbi:hypothetical protein D9M68_935280 [compost metagenome]